MDVVFVADWRLSVVVGSHTCVALVRAHGIATVILAVLKMIFNFILGPGGPGGGSGLPFSEGNHRCLADSGPNPKKFNFYFGPKHS